MNNTRANEDQLRELLATLVRDQKKLRAAGADRDWVQAVIANPNEVIPEMVAALNTFEWRCRKKRFDQNNPVVEGILSGSWLTVIVPLKEIDIDRREFLVSQDFFFEWSKRHMNRQRVHLESNVMAAKSTWTSFGNFIKPDRDYIIPTQDGRILAKLRNWGTFLDVTTRDYPDILPEMRIIFQVEDLTPSARPKFEKYP